jgi:hypothetical protein
MNNQYFWLDSFGMYEEPILDNQYSSALQTLRAGRDFVPGNPLVIEDFHVSSFDREAGKYIRRPAALAFFNIPRINQEGRITATAKWPYKNSDEFAAFLMQTEYCHFVDEHWAEGDFDSKFTSTNDFQVVRFQFVNHVSAIGEGKVGVWSETVL